MHPTGPALAVACLAVASLLAGCATPHEARADHHEEGAHRIVTPSEVPWEDGPASLPAGARVALLSGDPAKEGPFTLRFELPAGYVVPPHTHPRVERVTILSGTAYLGMGASVDRANATELSSGSFFELPPGMVHHLIVGDAPVMLQLHGEGPWGIDYVDPADDPRLAPAP